MIEEEKTESIPEPEIEPEIPTTTEPKKDYSNLSYNELNILYEEQNAKYTISPSHELHAEMAIVSKLITDKRPKEVIEQKPKKRFSFSFKRNKLILELNMENKEFKKLEVYCQECKHTIQDHERKGRSEGCYGCGCLKSILDIFNESEKI